MQRLLLTLCLLLAVPGWGLAADTATDNFDRADGTLGANWTTVAGMQNPTIASNVVQDATMDGTTSISIRTAESFANDQYAYITATKAITSGARIVGVVLRGTTAARTEYECQVLGPLGSTATLTIYRLNAGAATQLGTTGAVVTVNPGDTVYCQMRGSTVTMKINGVTRLGPIVDGTPIASGKPGILVHASSGTTADAQLDNFGAGDLAATAVGSSAADTFYVRTATACPNNGDGLSYACASSEGAPGAFNYLANVIWTPTTGVDDGDTLYVCGKHRETFTLGTFSATASAWGTVSLDCPSDTGTITGSNIESSWTGPDGNGNYSSGSTYTTPLWLLVDGAVARHGGPTAADLTAGQWFFSASHILYHGDPTGHTIEVPVRGTIIDGNTNTQSFLRITGGRLEGGRYATSTAGIFMNDCSNVLINNMTIYATWKAIEFNGSCTNAEFSNNTVTYCGDCLDMIESVTKPTNIRFLNNYVQGTVLLGTDFFIAYAETSHSISIDKECIATTSGGSGYSIEFNEILYCADAISLLPNSNVTNYSIRGNIIHHSYDDAIQVSCSGGCTVTESFITGNLIYSGGQLTSSHGIITEGGLVGTAPGSKVDVTNNTIYNWGGGLAINPFNGTVGYSNGNIVNNIVMNLNTNGTDCTTTCYFQADNWQNMVAGGAVINNNLYYTSTGFAALKFNMPGFAVRSSLSAHQTDMAPNEAASLNVDPLFLSTSDFRTKGTSPVRRAGKDGYSCIDPRGRPCYHPPDIGAYQASSRNQAATRAPRQ